MITVVFLGRLRDAAGAREQRLELPTPATVAALIVALGALSPGLAEQLNDHSIRIAINKTLKPVPPDKVLKAGDEIAFLPPVTGG